MTAVRWKLAVLAALLLTAGRAQAGYVVTNLGTLGTKDSVSAGRAVNDSGQVAGHWNPESGPRHAFLYDGATMIDLNPLLVGIESVGNGINNNGLVVGSWTTSGGQQHAFRYDSATHTMTDLSMLGGHAVNFAGDINNKGDITGYFGSGGDLHAFLYDRATDTTTYSGMTLGGFSIGTAINDSGQVVGYSEVSAGFPHAFLYESGTIQDLGVPSGDDTSRALDINDSGWVVGYSHPNVNSNLSHAFLYDGAMRDLGTLGGNFSEGFGINNAGQAVGYSLTSDGHYHAFLYDGGIMTDLNGLIPAGSAWTLIEARDINNKGQITGYGSYNGQVRAFLLTPAAVPEPSGLVLFSLAAFGLAAAALRRRRGQFA